MRIQQQLVDILTVIDPELYRKSTVFENSKKTLNVQFLRVIYGILISKPLF